MERIRCNCKQCDGTIGIFVNVWTRIGKSYFSPILEPETELHVRGHGDMREGEIHSLVEDCQLQDISCTACDAIIGLECVQTPINHVLQEKQILLRRTSVISLSVVGDNHAEFSVKRVLQLRRPTAKASGRASMSKQGHVGESTTFVGNHGDASEEGHIELSHIQADLDVQREDIDRIDSAGYQIVSAFDDAVLRIEREMKSLQDSFKSFKKDISNSQNDLSSLRIEVTAATKAAKDTEAIDNLGTKTSSLETAVSNIRRDLDVTSLQLRTDLTAVESSLKKTRQEVDNISGVVNGLATGVGKYEKEVKSLRTEMTTMRKLFGQARSGQSTVMPGSHPSSREVDILASNIAKIGNRASQVETLQMEFDILKGRVERMEAEYGSTAEPDIGESGNIPQEQCKTGRKKRPSSTSRPSLAPSWPADVVDSSGKRMRLTKSGAVDKRSQRRTSRRLVDDKD